MVFLAVKHNYINISYNKNCSTNAQAFQLLPCFGVFLLKFCLHFTFPCPSISAHYIPLPYSYLVKVINYEAHECTIFFHPPLTFSFFIHITIQSHISGTKTEDKRVLISLGSSLSAVERKMWTKIVPSHCRAL